MNYISARTPMIRRRRGMGQGPAGGIDPSNPCYDPTHDGGIIHCASFSNVFMDAIPFFGRAATTTCSDQEKACFQNAAAAFAAGDPGAASILNNGAGEGSAAQPDLPDACSSAVGFTCPTVALGVAGLLALFMLAPLLTAGRRF